MHVGGHETLNVNEVKATFSNDGGSQRQKKKKLYTKTNLLEIMILKYVTARSGETRRMSRDTLTFARVL